MKSEVKVFGFIATVILSFSGITASAVVVNDGTTTNNLAKVANANGAELAVAGLTISNGVLVATQSPTTSGFPLRNAWISRTHAPTGGLYSVSADFRPAEPDFRRRGGVIGWLNLESQAGIALYLTPPLGEDPTTAYFQVATVDFSAPDDSRNESFTNLFNATDGLQATEDLASARSPADNYNPTNLATFELNFSAPTPADLALVSNATVRLAAKVYQTAGGVSNQVGRTIDLLTTLPLPNSSRHRFGYFAYWASTLSEGSAIGDLDNLTLNGGFSVPTNVPPLVTLTSPTNGASYATPAEILLMAAASDPDGQITRVDFVANSTVVGSSSTAPYSFTWTNLLQGTFNLTARATDDSGNVTTSTPAVVVTVSGPPEPFVTVLAPFDGSIYQAPAEIVVAADAQPSLQAPIDAVITGVDFLANSDVIATNVPFPFAFTWTNFVAGSYALEAIAYDNYGGAGISTNVVRITVTNAPPVATNVQLTITRPSTNLVEISWPAGTGLQLQSKTNLSLPTWTIEPGTATTNRLVVPANVPTRFFRLRSAG